ncbi:MAG TPA: triose-phosphate isomerase [Caulobacteraceae bacterium]|nr:triose-phosphate isomerase [Caulobacteraceae bacterium]
MPTRALIAGNWKMHGLTTSLDQARALAARVERTPPAARIAICPPATLIRLAAEVLAGSSILVGAQDCRPEPQGPFTGDLAPEMVAEAGARLVILGHSERRAYHGETDALVGAKVCGALRAGLEPIVCIGESEEERRAGKALSVVTGQLRGSLPAEALGTAAFALAYEPVWAIGSGKTPTLEQIEEMHGALREALLAHVGAAAREAPILYGGSVKPGNAAEILAVPEVGGALVGGASLQAAEFAAIFEVI